MTHNDVRKIEIMLCRFVPFQFHKIRFTLYKKTNEKSGKLAPKL